MRPGDYVVLAVSDTGCGIDAETQERIFEPFFTTKPHGEGTGLGLSTIYGIMDQHGGFVRIHSEVGIGTTAKAYFPRAAGAPLPVADTPRAHPPGGHETILLVEDEEMVRNLARRALERAGYRVLQAAEGGAALLQSDEHSGAIELLLTDVVMPLMSGRELHERLRAKRPELRVVFMSGYTENAIAHHGAWDETELFLQKPFKVAGLLEVVRAALDRPS